MAKKLNQHVMTASFREGLTNVYADALAAWGVFPDEIVPHIIGTATVTVTEADLARMREVLSGLVELSGHSNAGRIEISLPEGAQYLTDHRPTLTQEQREAKRAGKGVVASKEEAKRRNETREALRRKLAEQHGIDLDEEDEA